MNPEKYKIGIIGLGPVGLVLAAHMQEAGCEVHICDVEKKKINLIRSDGIELSGRIEKNTFFKRVYSSLNELLDQEINILISAVKAYHVDSVLDQIKERSNRNLFLLSAQNGIDIREKYTSHFDESQILRMVVNFAGNLHSPNVVNVTFFNPPNYIASVDDSRTDIAEWLSETLTSASLETECKDSFVIADKIW
jgi:2-dehydropantoate 2-reductase